MKQYVYYGPETGKTGSRQDQDDDLFLEVFNQWCNEEKPISYDRKGKMTKWGISSRWYSGEVPFGEIDINSASDYMKDTVWTRHNLADIAITNERLAFALFHVIGNAGPDDAIRPLQLALCLLGIPTLIDGVLGPKTKKATCEYRHKDALFVAWFHLIVKQYFSKNDDKHINGWLNRLNRISLK